MRTIRKMETLDDYQTFSRINVFHFVKFALISLEAWITNRFPSFLFSLHISWIKSVHFSGRMEIADDSCNLFASIQQTHSLYWQVFQVQYNSTKAVTQIDFYVSIFVMNIWIGNFHFHPDVIFSDPHSLLIARAGSNGFAKWILQRPIA